MEPQAQIGPGPHTQAFPMVNSQRGKYQAWQDGHAMLRGPEKQEKVQWASKPDSRHPTALDKQSPKWRTRPNSPFLCSPTTEAARCLPAAINTRCSPTVAASMGLSQDSYLLPRRPDHPIADRCFPQNLKECNSQAHRNTQPGNSAPTLACHGSSPA